MSRRGLVVMACALAAGLAAPAAARRDHSLSGDATKAARLIAEARLDDARPIVAELARRAPDAAEVRWLASQVAFWTATTPPRWPTLDGVADTPAAARSARARAGHPHGPDRGFVHHAPRRPAASTSPTPPGSTRCCRAGRQALDRAWERIGDDLGYRPTGKVRVGSWRARRPGQAVAADRVDIGTTGTIARAVEVREADAGVAARDA
jgi:hypothetical protein